jgi:tetratricopeptide (TPR) repeat protein
MKQTHALFLSLLFTYPASAKPFIVENGQPRAEIVIAENPLPATRLAAQELQDGIRKMSGAHLPIVNQPGAGKTHVFVGPSTHTERLKITTADLKQGAFRMVSGEDWLALLGEDTAFTPIEPWGRHNADLTSGRAQKAWREKTNSLWGLPNLLIYKDRLSLPGTTGLPDALRGQGKLPPLEIWAQEERGSFNAVCGWLMKLGARWYAPGEIGEVMPSLPTIPLSKLDETVRPDFPIRRFNVRLGIYGPDTALWAMRLGLRDPYGIECAHGMDTLTNHEEVFAKHPDWYAMVGGQRRFQRGANNHLCYSNEELLQETVRYVRAVFDHYKMDVVSVMPPDGYTSICQCDLCKGQDSPEREQRGLASDYIWDFVNRVAKEVRQTHPDKKVLNCGYGIYTLPPLKIDKLEPNVVVSIVGGRRPMNNQPADQEDCRQLREAWLAKTSQPLIIFENYPLTDRGWYLPAFTPHSLGTSINATKGISQGEDIWLSMRQGDFEKQPDGALNHFMVYFTQRMYWGGRETDVDALFREYCRLFYGPAEQEMHAFLIHCEAHWQAMEKDKSLADTALALFDKAKAKSDSASIFGRRLAMMDVFIKGLRNKAAQLGRLRGPMPVLRLVGPPKSKPVIDGRLDDDAWMNCPSAATVRLRELQTGRPPVFGTQVKAAWLGHDLYFAIRCEEPRCEKPLNTATRHDDAALWQGDAIELLLETEARSYYQIAISPSGAVCDLDRSATRDKWFSWNAKAEVATRIEDGHWIAEVRLPITQDENDPLHQVIGSRPIRSLPWHINLCRQRIREDGSEYSAFSPTGADHFHAAMKFATFYDGNSFEFDHGPPEDDFLERTRIAGDLARTGKREEALVAYTATAEGKFTDLQKSHALEIAAALARGLKQSDLATQLIARIPVPAAQKAAHMQHLVETGHAPDVIRDFSGEDIGTWPFWKRGDGYHARGRAWFITKAGDKAETDLTAALDWTSEPVKRDAIWLLLAQNRETSLKNDAQALAAYNTIVEGRTHIGGASEFAALQGIARIQTRQGRFDEALKTLNRAQPDKLQGVWRENIQKSIDAVNQARRQP